MLVARQSFLLLLIRMVARAVLILWLAGLFTWSAEGINFKISPKEELCFHEITHKGKPQLEAFLTTTEAIQQSNSVVVAIGVDRKQGACFF